MRKCTVCGSTKIEATKKVVRTGPPKGDGTTGAYVFDEIFDRE